MLEKISIGNVVVFGLEIKLVIIRLLSDKVKVSNQLEMIVGMIIGSVMMKNIFSGVVLRFIAVFFIE